jgi:hypothetical protein
MKKFGKPCQSINNYRPTVRFEITVFMKLNRLLSKPPGLPLKI